MKNFINFSDLNLNDLSHILERAAFFKLLRKKGEYRYDHLKGRSVGMIFNKNSTRTRVSFECAINELGGCAVVLNDQQTQFSRGEPLSHSAKVLSRYLAALVIRTYAQSSLDILAEHADIPIINALTDEGHPCQILADILTISEKFPDKALNSLHIAWVGDGNNMANSWLEAAAIFGFKLSLGVPEEYKPDMNILKQSQALNSNIELFHDPIKAVAEANVINTDVWASMGQEGEAGLRKEVFEPFQVNANLMAKAASKAIFMHCLPAHIGEEVTEEVLESSASVIFDQAENRLHAQKALLEFLIPKI